MDILRSINWIDVLGIIFVLASAYFGIKNGLTIELFRFIGSVVSLIVSIQFYGQAADAILENISIPAWLAQFLCFLLIAQIVKLIFKYGITAMLKVLSLSFVPQMERIGGALMGIGRGLVFFGIVLLALTLIPQEYILDSIYDGSYSGVYVIKAMDRTYRALLFWMPPDKLEKDIFLVPAYNTKAARI